MMKNDEKQMMFERKTLKKRNFNEDFLTYMPEKPRSSEPLENIIKTYQGYLKSETSSALHAFVSIVAECKHGDSSLCIKLLPKLLHLLESEKSLLEHKKALLECCDIDSSKWISFLPILLSRIKNLGKVKKINEKEERLMEVLIKLCTKCAIRYPEDTFFALEYLKFSENDIINDNLRKLHDVLYSLHPALVSKLEEIVEIVNDLKPGVHEHYLHFSKNLLNKAYSCVFESLKENKSILDSTIITSNFSKMLTPDELSILKRLESLDCSTRTVLDLLKEYVFNFDELCARYQNQERDRIFRKFQLLSNCLLEADLNISLFGQSTLESSSSIKIYKFSPDIETVILNGNKVNLLTLLGDDGKVYNYFMVYDYFTRKEIWVTVKLRQLLQNLSFLLKKNANCSKYLNFAFPRITPVGSYFTFVPNNLKMISHLDIYKYTGKKYFSSHDYFSHLFEVYCMKTKENIRKLVFDSIEVPDDILIDHFLNHLKSPLDFFAFKTEFVNSVAVLITLPMFFNISTEELLISTKSGAVSTFHLKFGLGAEKAVINFLTKNIKSLIGPLGLKVITKNIISMADVLKDKEEEIIRPFLHLMKEEREEYSKEVVKEMDEIIKSVLNNLNYTHMEIQNLLLSSSKSDFLSQLNPVLYRWF